MVPHSRAKQEDPGSNPALGKSGKFFLKTLRAGIEQLNLEEMLGGSIGLVAACGDRGRRFESRWRRYEASCKGIELVANVDQGTSP